MPRLPWLAGWLIGPPSGLAEVAAPLVKMKIPARRRRC